MQQPSHSSSVRQDGRLARFFAEGLGFRVSDEVPALGASFMRCSTDHHNLLVQPGPFPFVHHTAWEMDDVDAVGRAAAAMVAADPARHVWGLGRHGIGSNFFWYLRDPAGNFAEYTSDLDVIVDDEAWKIAASARAPVLPGPRRPAPFLHRGRARARARRGLTWRWIVDVALVATSPSTAARDPARAARWRFASSSDARAYPLPRAVQWITRLRQSAAPAYDACSPHRGRVHLRWNRTATCCPDRARPSDPRLALSLMFCTDSSGSATGARARASCRSSGARLVGVRDPGITWGSTRGAATTTRIRFAPLAWFDGARRSYALSPCLARLGFAFDCLVVDLFPRESPAGID